MINIKEPKFRCGTSKAINELVAQYNYPYSDWMQDWPYEIADPKQIDVYFQHYKEQTDNEKKFCLMEMLIQALDDIDNESEFSKKWTLLRKIIINDFEIHEYTIFYWSCFGLNLDDCWRISSYMQELWIEVKNT